MNQKSRRFSPIDFKMRFPALDGIRALAVTLVFLVHYGGGTHGGRLLSLFNSIRLRGWMGVDLFFVLSGFLITGILYDTREDSKFFTRFFARRSLRIFPVFYLLVAIVLLLTPIFRYQWHTAHLAFLFYLGNIFGSVNPSLYQVAARHHSAGDIMLWHLWSLCVEEQFYLLWPIVVWWVRDRRRLIQIAAGLSAAALALRIVLALGPQSASRIEWTMHTLPARMDTLLFGAILALLLRGPNAERYQRACKWMFVGCLAPAIAICIVSPSVHSPWLLTIGFTFVAAASAGLIGTTLRAGSTAFRLFHLRPLRIFGQYSYGFYIYHMVWLVAWVRLAEFMGMKLHSTVLGNTLVMATNALVTFFVAKLSYDLFEIRWLRMKVRFAYDMRIEKRRNSVDLNQPCGIGEMVGADAVMVTQQSEQV
jgi:peptidoglycan/LPS O-acetylase OafA/YrhL